MHVEMNMANEHVQPKQRESWAEDSTCKGLRSTIISHRDQNVEGDAVEVGEGEKRRAKLKSKSMSKSEKINPNWEAEEMPRTIHYGGPLGRTLR
jgi:hypothetical protein